jgi:Glycosyl transferase family 11
MGNPYPIIVRLQGGLGNQLYQYAAGRALAMYMDRPLLIDQRTIEPEAPARQYDLGSFNVKESFVHGLSAFCTRWVGSVRLGPLFQMFFPTARAYRLIRDSEKGYDTRIFERHDGPIILHGYWQSYRYFEGVANDLRRELQFRYAPDPENARMIDLIESSASVALHVRRGDYVRNAAFSAALGTCDSDYYRRAVAKIASEIPNPKFFVFSDDADWAASNLDLPGKPVVVRHNLGRSDVEDFRLMTHCRHFIIANSSFSWWGAWLAHYPSKTVIAPARWFNVDNTPPQDRIPLSWARL